MKKVILIGIDFFPSVPIKEGGGLGEDRGKSMPNLG